MDALLQDLRVSLRHLVRDARTSVVIVLCAALAIGLNSSIFNIVHAFVLRAPAIDQADEMVRLYSTYPGFEFASLSYPHYTDLRDQSEVFSGLAAYSIRPANLTVDGDTEQINSMMATGNYFTTLGIKATRGRLFTESDDQVRGGHPVIVIGHQLWQSRFGGDDGVIGKKVVLNGHPFTVIGVGDPEFTGNIPGFVIDLWVPMQMQPVMMPADADWLDARGQGWLSSFARLAPGVSREQAKANLDLVVGQIKAANPNLDENWQVDLYSGISPIPPNVGNMLQASAVIILVLVFLVLLITCANVASLLLARAEARQKEISIRLAIGANRWRLVRQLLTESLVLSAFGGGIGILIAIWTSRVFPTLIPSFGVPITFDTSPDATVLAVTALLTVATGCLFGLVPALQASKPDLVTTLKGEASSQQGRRRRLPLRQALVAFQVAVSVLLLVGAGLFIRSLQRERQVDPGFKTDNVMLAHLDPSLYGYDAERGLQLYDELQRKVSALPGVLSVSFGEIAPLTFANSQQWGVEIEGYEPAPEERMNPDYNIVSEDFFAALEIPILEGRGFERSDDADGRPVMVVNQAMADRFWAGEALGKRVRMGGDWHEVVGVVATGKYRSLREAPVTYMYLPLRQRWEPAQEMFVRTAGDPMSLVQVTRAALREIDPNLPLTNVRTLEKHTEGALFLAAMGAKVIGLFGALALTLATIGLFGVLTHSVARRTREIGIRMSLGARQQDVFSQLLKEGLRLTALGLGVGLLGAFAMGRLLSGLLYGLGGSDLVAFLIVAGVLLTTSVLAIAVPALRATRIHPVTALHYE